MTHRDDLARLSPLSVRCGDAAHRKACATQGPPVAESLDKPSLWVIINAPRYYAWGNSPVKAK